MTDVNPEAPAFPAEWIATARWLASRYLNGKVSSAFTTREHDFLDHAFPDESCDHISMLAYFEHRGLISAEKSVFVGTETEGRQTDCAREILPGILDFVNQNAATFIHSPAQQEPDTMKTSDTFTKFQEAATLFLRAAECTNAAVTFYECESPQDAGGIASNFDSDGEPNFPVLPADYTQALEEVIRFAHMLPAAAIILQAVDEVDQCVRSAWSHLNPVDYQQPTHDNAFDIAEKFRSQCDRLSRLAAGERSRRDPATRQPTTLASSQKGVEVAELAPEQIPDQTTDQTIPANQTDESRTKCTHNGKKQNGKKSWTPTATQLKNKWFAEMRRRKKWIPRKTFFTDFLASSEGKRKKWQGLKDTTEDRRFQDNPEQWKAESEELKAAFKNGR